MVTEYIVNFVQYLNKNDFNISVDKIFRFFEMVSDNNISFINKNEVISIMKIVFCSSKLEVANLPNLFDSYFQNVKTFSEIDNLKKEKEELKQNYLNSEQEQKKKLDTLNKAIEMTTNDIVNDEIVDLNLFNKKELKFINENKEEILKIKFSNKKCNSFLKDCIINNDSTKINNYSSGFVKNVSDELIKISEKFLKKNKIENFIFIKEVYDLVKKVENYNFKQTKILNNKIKEATKDLEEKKKKIELDWKKEENKHKQIQNELEIKLNKLNSQKQEIVIQKEKSIHNRENFIGGNRNIQLIKEQDVLNCIEKDFKSLNQEEMNILYSFIKKNLISFKTKMNRNIYSFNKEKLNIQQTIQYACKTSGLPLNLYYEERKKSKTNLVLILDISGSCSIASEMMLSFMYLLKDVFSGGCTTYSFVNSLYNISDIMKSNDIKDSINTVLNTIPRKGVYSNYYEPLKSLWENNKKTITSDSIVIFMGDARNNKNDKGLDYIKNISRRAKSCYWLNTEEYEKWGKADSLAFDYMKYCKMYEILNTSDLIYFINTFK